jgi:hypothetical protein
VDDEAGEFGRPGFDDLFDYREYDAKYKPQVEDVDDEYGSRSLLYTAGRASRSWTIYRSYS